MFENIRGTLRIEPTEKTVKPAAASNTAVFGSVRSAGEGTPVPADNKDGDASWLTSARKLIPGEALTGYLSLQMISSVAKHKETVSIILALAFLMVTIVLSWAGTQDPKAANPKAKPQIWSVVLSSLTFIGFVYATKGQIFWHPHLDDQELYGQILVLVLGIVGPTLASRPRKA